MTKSVALKAVRNTLYNGARQSVVMLAAICTSVVVARTLGPTNMGVLGFTLWLVGLLGILASLGLPNAAIKYISEHLGRGDIETASYLSRRLLLSQLLLALAVASLAACAAAAFGRNYKPVLLIGAVLVLPRAIQQALSGSLAGTQRYDKVALIGFCVALAEVISVALAALSKAGTVGMIGAILAGDTVGLAAGVIATKKALLWPTSPFHASKMEEEFRRVRKFYLTVSYILVLNAIVWERSEVLFLKWTSTLPQIAFYSIAFALAGKLSEAASVCTNTLMPLCSECFGRSGLTELRAIYARGLKYIQMGIVPLSLCGIVLSRPAISFSYGEQYLPIVPVVQILLLGTVVTTLGGVGSSLIYGTDKQMFIAKFGTAVAVVNIVMDVILIPRFGAIGAAIANTTAQLLGVVAGLAYAKSLLSARFPWMDTVKIYAAAFLAIVPVLYATNRKASPGYLIVAVVISAVVYFACLVGTGGLGDAELSLFRSSHIFRLRVNPTGVITSEKGSL